MFDRRLHTNERSVVFSTAQIICVQIPIQVFVINVSLQRMNQATILQWTVNHCGVIELINFPYTDWFETPYHRVRVHLFQANQMRTNNSLVSGHNVFD